MEMYNFIWQGEYSVRSGWLEHKQHIIEMKRINIILVKLLVGNVIFSDWMCICSAGRLECGC